MRWVLLFSGAVLAGFPEKPIQILVGFKAGGGVDTMSRILAEVMSKDLGKPVIVINKAGGGGNLACTALSREKADGYSIGISPSSPMVFNALKGKGRRWSVDSFCYLGTGARFQDSFVAKSDAPFGDFLSMLEYAKKNNKKLRFSSVTPTDAAYSLGRVQADRRGPSARAHQGRRGQHGRHLGRTRGLRLQRRTPTPSMSRPAR